MKFGTYKILPQKRLVIEYYSGDLEADDLILFKSRISEDLEYNYNFKTICDYRNCVLNLDLNSDFDRFVDYIKEHFKERENRYTAYLTNTPNQLVITTLFSRVAEINNLKIFSTIFSTVKGVVNWFGNTLISEKEFNAIIKELQSKSTNLLSH